MSAPLLDDNTIRIAEFDACLRSQKGFQKCVSDDVEKYVRTTTRLLNTIKESLETNYKTGVEADLEMIIEASKVLQNILQQSKESSTSNVVEGVAARLRK